MHLFDQRLIKVGVTGVGQPQVAVVVEAAVGAEIEG